MLGGSMVALVTPMTDDGRIDEQALEALVDFHLRNQTDAIIAMGTTGESATLSHKEHRHVVKQVVKYVNGKIPVIAGTGSNNTVEALDLTAAAKQDGADACLLVTPYYNKNVLWHMDKRKESAKIYSDIAIPMFESGRGTDVANMIGFIGVYFPEKAKEISDLMEKKVEAPK